LNKIPLNQSTQPDERAQKFKLRATCTLHSPSFDHAIAVIRHHSETEAELAEVLEMVYFLKLQPVLGSGSPCQAPNHRRLTVAG
jgi:hypothetical protein